MGRRGKLGALPAFVIALALVLSAPAAQALEVRMAPEGSTWIVVLKKAAKAISEASSGRVTLKYYSGGQQGDEHDVVRKMKVGQLDGAALTGTGLALIDESIRVLELPMMFKDTKELDCVRRKMWPSFKRRFAKKGYQLGEPGDVGFIYFYSKKPVKSLSDLKSTKVWMWANDRLVRAMFKRLGINGVPMGVPDVKAALQTGRIGAAYGSPLATVAMQWNSNVKYVTSMPLTYAIGASVIRNAVTDKISTEDQAAIKKQLKKTGKTIRKEVRKSNRRAKRAMKRAGVKTIDTPPALVAEFDQAAQDVWKQLAGKVYSQKQLDKVLEYRAKCRK